MREEPENKEQTSVREVDPRVLEVLVCPVTKSRLEYDRAAGELVSRAAGLAYPIRDGIPVMLAGEARQLSDAERDRSR
ncbi:MAG: Trm112 family protein [Rhizobiales bacterium]|nr:Trm112 family protein [Hyphomicrobiales bacterium]